MFAVCKTSLCVYALKTMPGTVSITARYLSIESSLKKEVRWSWDKVVDQIQTTLSFPSNHKAHPVRASHENAQASALVRRSITA